MLPYFSVTNFLLSAFGLLFPKTHAIWAVFYIIHVFWRNVISYSATFFTGQENQTGWKTRKHTNCYLLLTADDQEHCGQLFLAKNLVACPHIGWVSLFAHLIGNKCTSNWLLPCWSQCGCVVSVEKSQENKFSQSKKSLKIVKKCWFPASYHDLILQIVVCIATEVIYFKPKGCCHSANRLPRHL